MIFKEQTLHSLMDSLDRGILFIDRREVIQCMNTCAGKITGTAIECPYAHDGGKIAAGDIVIIADSGVGEDDGAVGAEELLRIGINDGEIKRGDMLTAVGVFCPDKEKAVPHQKNEKPVYKYLREHLCTGLFGFEREYRGLSVGAWIDTKRRLTQITAGKYKFSLPYFYNVGHMAVIDGKSGKLKFYQAKGYSVRHESIGELLRGGSFSAKKSGWQQIAVNGRNVGDVFKGTALSEAVRAVLNGEKDEVRQNLFDINKRLVVGSVFPAVFPKAENEELKNGKAEKQKENEDIPELRKTNAADGVWLVLQEAEKLELLLEDRDRILLEIESRFKKREKEYRMVPEGLFEEFDGCKSYMSEIKYLAYKAAKTKFNVMLTGESGTGKSLLARQIHQTGNPDGPYVEVNCAAIAPSLFESELFGYVGGAFTGALSAGKAGYFEAADGGTIFLDEIGELPLEIQAKLLYVFQNKTIYRVGSSRPTKVNVRVITATNKDLGEAVKNGTFRQDLYYRINVFPIHLPPLRERREDLPLMIQRILRKTCAAFGLGTKRLSGEAMKKLIAYDWPGNVRELENVLQRASALCDTDILFAEHIYLENMGDLSDNKKNRAKETMAEGALTEEAMTEAQDGGISDNAVMPPVTQCRPLKVQLEAWEAALLRETLERNHWNKEAVIDELKISKTVLYEKIKKYELSKRTSHGKN